MSQLSPLWAGIIWAARADFKGTFIIYRKKRYLAFVWLFAAADLKRRAEKRSVLFLGVEKWRPLLQPRRVCWKYPCGLSSRTGTKALRFQFDASPVSSSSSLSLLILLLPIPYGVTVQNWRHEHICIYFSLFHHQLFSNIFEWWFCRLPANSLSMSLVDCQGCEDITSNLSSPFLFFLVPTKLSKHAPPIPPQELLCPRYTRDTSTPAYTTHQTIARTHVVSPPSSKFQAKPNTRLFGGQKAGLFYL